MKKFKKLLYLLLIIIIASFAIILYNTISRGEENKQQEKGMAEVEFLESKITNLLNSMNNIQTTNYNISVTEVTEEMEESNSSSSSQKYDLKSAGVLNNTTEVDWATVKSEVEVLYTSIPTITLDLYSLNIAQEDVLTFNQEFDNLTVAVQEENKDESLQKLATLYGYIPKFISAVTEDELKIVEAQTKSKIFQAYANVDKEDWSVIQNNVQQGIEIFSKLLTTVNIDSSKEYTVNKCYVMLNELQNAVGLQDKAVFYIKYKNLLEEMNAI